MTPLKPINIRAILTASVKFLAGAGVLAIIYTQGSDFVKAKVNGIEPEDICIYLAPATEFNNNKIQRIYFINKSKTPIDDVKISVHIPNIRNSGFIQKLSQDALLQKKDFSIGEDNFQLVFERLVKDNSYYCDLIWRGTQLTPSNIKFDAKNIHVCTIREVASDVFK
jgi:hypothetical protein